MAITGTYVREGIIDLVADEAANYAPVGSEKKLGNNLVDVHKQRLELMDQLGVEMQVLSLTSPGPQGIPPNEEVLI
jgi:2,3-dihydroxybenzoate decarboxylase